MTSPLSSQTSPTHKNNQPLRGSPFSKHPYVTCHIVCQPRSLPPWLRPPPHREIPNPSHLPALPVKERKGKGPCTTYTSLSRG